MKLEERQMFWIVNGYGRLHTFGLLRGAFSPDVEMTVLRSYWSQRANLVSSCSMQIHLMQKALDQMNLHLHKVITEIAEETGMKIIRKIVAGERNPNRLALLKHFSVKSSVETITQALTGNYREEHLFSLKQALEMYDIYQEKIKECDEQTVNYMLKFKNKAEMKDLPEFKPKKRRRNEPYFDLKKELFRITGVDLTSIDGINTLTAQTIISEIGLDMKKFPTEKHFSSWLGLSPNNQITGGKIKKRKTKKVYNRVTKQ